MPTAPPRQRVPFGALARCLYDPLPGLGSQPLAWCAARFLAVGGGVRQVVVAGGFGGGGPPPPSAPAAGAPGELSFASWHGSDPSPPSDAHAPPLSTPDAVAEVCVFSPLLLKRRTAGYGWAGLPGRACRVSGGWGGVDPAAEVPVSRTPLAQPRDRLASAEVCMCLHLRYYIINRHCINVTSDILYV